MPSKLLILFVKNPVLGKVKTRLAKSIGDSKALSVYNKLLLHCREITNSLPFDKKICYSDEIQNDDIWKENIYQKSIQNGADLGERMLSAFKEGFSDGYDQICIIGTDIIELTSDIMFDAFELLDHNDVVLGPSADGGYYLIGMTVPHNPLFKNISWSTDKVLAETKDSINEAGLSCEMLAELNDIDELKDIRDEYKDYLLS